MFRKKLIGVVAAICAIAAVTAAIAQGSGTSQGSSTKSKGATAHAAQAGSPGPPGDGMGGPGGPHGMGGPDGGAVHSVGVVPDKAGTAFVTLTTDRGTVQSVDSGAGTITIVEGTKSATYKTLTLSVPSGAKVTRNGASASLGDVKAKDDISIGSSSEGTTVFAMDSSFHPEHGHGRGGPPGMMGGPPPGQEASGAEAKSGTGTKTGTGTTTTE